MVSFALVVQVRAKLEEAKSSSTVLPIVKLGLADNRRALKVRSDKNGGDLSATNVSRVPVLYSTRSVVE